MSDENKMEETKAVAVAEEECHSSFNSDHADLVLQSKDGIKFRVHSQILRIASPVFNDMLSIERDRSETSSSPIHLEESALVLETMLDTMYPQHYIPSTATLSAQLIYDVGIAARKYDIDTVSSTMQNCLYARQVMGSLSPLHKFGVARRLGWDDVAQWASTDTLGMDLSTRASQAALATLDTASVLALHALHRRRKVILINALLSVCNELPFSSDVDESADALQFHEISTASSYVHRSDCEALTQLRGLSAWSKLKFAVVAEMERCPLGSRFLVDDFFDIVEFSGLWSAKMSCSCLGKAVETKLDKARFKSAFRAVLSNLPTSISESSGSSN